MGGPINVDLEQYSNASGEAPAEADKATVVEVVGAPLGPVPTEGGTDVIVENTNEEA